MRYTVFAVVAVLIVAVSVWTGRGPRKPESGSGVDHSEDASGTQDGDSVSLTHGEVFDWIRGNLAGKEEWRLMQPSATSFVVPKKDGLYFIPMSSAEVVSHGKLKMEVRGGPSFGAGQVFYQGPTGREYQIVNRLMVGLQDAPVTESGAIIIRRHDPFGPRKESGTVPRSDGLLGARSPPPGDAEPQVLVVKSVAEDERRQSFRLSRYRVVNAGPGHAVDISWGLLPATILKNKRAVAVPFALHVAVLPPIIDEMGRMEKTTISQFDLLANPWRVVVVDSRETDDAEPVFMREMVDPIFRMTGAEMIDGSRHNNWQAGMLQIQCTLPCTVVVTFVYGEEKPPPQERRGLFGTPVQL